MRTDSLAQAAQYFSGRSLTADAELCTNLRGRHEHCRACVEACPHEALTLSLDQVLVAGDRCSGCGGCVPQCPAGALSLSGFSPVQLVELTETAQTLHLHCRESRTKQGGVVIPCHALIDARLLLALQGSGPAEIVLHGLDGCGDCQVGRGEDAVVAALDEAQAWVEAGYLQVRIGGAADDRVKRVYADQPKLSRRGFLKMASAQTLVEAAAYWVPVQEEAPGDLLPFFQANDQPQRPHPYLQLLRAQATRIPWRSAASRPWPRRSIADACTACMVCAERCPTGALSGAREGAQRRILYRAGLCSDCSLCESICPAGALVAGECAPIDGLDQTQTLLFRQRHLCERCGDEFDPGGEASTLCRICANERELDDAWLGMLGG